MKSRARAVLTAEAVRQVASLLRVPFVMVVNPSFPAKAVPEFITYAKANPGKVKSPIWAVQ